MRVGYGAKARAARLAIVLVAAMVAVIKGTCSLMKPHITLGELHSTRILHPTSQSHEFTVSITTADSSFCEWKDEPVIELLSNDKQSRVMHKVAASTVEETAEANRTTYFFHIRRGDATRYQQWLVKQGERSLYGPFWLPDKHLASKRRDHNTILMWNVLRLEDST